MQLYHRYQERDRKMKKDTAVYCREEPTDRAELLQFINQVFQEDFSEFMEKVYRNDRSNILSHHLIKEKGKIVAALGIYPQTIHLGNNELSTGYIGSVSVAEDSRGQGYMRLLMQKARESMQQEGIVLAMLGGRRNRYGFFNYELGGMHWKFTFEEENIRLSVGWKEAETWKIHLVSEQDSEYLKEIYSLYQKKRIWCRSFSDFYVVCRTWKNQLFRLEHNGCFAGYMIANAELTQIPELAVIEPVTTEGLLSMIGACMLQNGKKAVVVRTNLWEPEMCCLMQHCCEFYELLPAMNCMILDYTKFFAFMLAFNKECHGLEDGSLVICIIENYQEGQVGQWQLSVKHGEISVLPCKEAKADLVLREKDVVNALFSPATELYKNRCNKPYPAGWFPFLFTPEQVDEF